MIYTDIEDDVVTKLQGALPADTVVLPLPENERDLLRPFEYGRVTVAFKNAQYGDGGDNRFRTTGPIAQTETISLEVLIQSRWLRDPDHGVFGLWEKVRRSLLGFRPADCKQMFIKDFDFIGREEGLYTYVSEFMCTRMVVEAMESPEDATARITRITTDDLTNNQSFVVP